MRIISPSLLSANFSNLSKEINRLKKAGLSRLHLDVMDGNFVPALTFGPMIIKFIRELTDLHLETHLMINNPHKSLDQYINAGSDTIIFHIEASKNPIDELIYIKDKNVLAGIAINPDTDEKEIEKLLDYLDYILIMSVYPGKGGQKFINNTIQKMKNIVKMKADKEILIGVDGGVNINTINSVYRTGIDVTIVGSGLFNSLDLKQRHFDLLNA